MKKTSTTHPKPTQRKLNKQLAAMWEMFTALKYGTQEEFSPRDICRKVKTDHTLASYMVTAGILGRTGRKWTWLTGEPTMQMVLDCYQIRLDQIEARESKKLNQAADQVQKSPPATLALPGPDPQTSNPTQMDLFSRLEALEARVDSIEANIQEFQVMVAEFKGTMNGMDRKLDQLLMKAL